jgi:hypothetical protein
VRAERGSTTHQSTLGGDLPIGGAICLQRLELTQAGLGDRGPGETGAQGRQLEQDMGDRPDAGSSSGKLA